MLSTSANCSTGADIDTTVVAPCHNSVDSIGHLLESLAAQTEAPPWELVVADHGSDDGTLDVVRASRDGLPRVPIVDASERKGPSFARNEGARSARGDHIVFMDADGVVDEGWFSALRDAVPARGMIASRFEGSVVNDAEALWMRSCPQQHGLMCFQYAEFLPYASASGLAMRRETF